jgi:hypothetical protein
MIFFHQFRRMKCHPWLENTTLKLQQATAAGWRQNSFLNLIDATSGKE